MRFSAASRDRAAELPPGRPRGWARPRGIARALERLAAFVAAIAVAAVGVACSGCPGLAGKAEEVPVELDWPDASPLGPVQPIEPGKAPPPPVESPRRAADGDPAADGDGDGDPATPDRNE